MFKIESYITPIILSYVDKYIKNFRLEDSQVSLWGGDASFHNLDLRLEVLEQELQLPFSFVSGHIHELLIHVPWTKLISEPIVVTINTIECILKLRSSGPAQFKTKENQRNVNSAKQQIVEAPPSYMQALINKIVNNIRIYCNNLILKYVEEDIVLSMNVKHLKLESANEKWEAAYSDVSPIYVTLRKVITVNDLTICLDKRNAAGKIELYQEPLLYRCSMTMHLLMNYNSQIPGKAATTRLDIYCNNMEFGITELQVPMFIRLIMLICSLEQDNKHLNSDSTLESTSTIQDVSSSSQSWTSWAWSKISFYIPTPWDDLNETQEDSNEKGNFLQIGFYVDDLSLTFKLSDSSSERGGSYYNQRKIRYFPILAVHLQGIYLETISTGITWANVAFGVSYATVTPLGLCTCGNIEAPEEDIVPYLKTGSVSNFHKSDSLFDAQATENQGYRRTYNTNWDYHMTTHTESVLLERTPAFVFEYLYQLEIPDEVSSEAISTMSLEYSNIVSRSATRICFGPLIFHLCSGFFHRLESLKVASSVYDYSSISLVKVEPSLQDLLPPSEEDFDALCECIPTATTRVTFFAPVIEIELINHPVFVPTRDCLFKKIKKSMASHSKKDFIKRGNFPKLTVECQLLDLSLTKPMFENRLVHTTCQLPDPPKQLFDACFVKQDIRILSFTSRLFLNQQKHTTIIVPCSASFNSKSIIKPQYWINPDIPHEQITFESESFTINGTKPKMLVVYHIINKILNVDCEDSISINHSTLLEDAVQDISMPHLEICIEGIRFKKVSTNSTVSVDVSLGSIKAFIFEPIDMSVKKHTDVQYDSSNIQQVLFISGPEPKTTQSSDRSQSDPQPLFTATMQHPIEPDIQKHPTILIFNLQEIQICFDPLLCRWMLYSPTNTAPIYPTPSEYKSAKHVNQSENSGSTKETPRKSSRIETVHSHSSDREVQSQLPQKLPLKIAKEDSRDLQERIYNFLKSWFNVWKGMILCGDISQCTIYFPTVSLSAVGSQGIHEAVEQTMNRDDAPDIMVVTLPFANIRSAQRQNIIPFKNVLPIVLPDNIWSTEKSSFPWTMSIADMSCYTIQNRVKLIFLKAVSLSATVGLSTRPTKSDAKETPPADLSINKSSSGSSSSKVDIGCLGVCVHIDMTPVCISTSEIQVALFATIIYGLFDIFSNLIPESSPKTVPCTPDVVQTIISDNHTVLPESTIETLSEHTSPPVSNITGIDNTEIESVKLTAWVQWTITRFTIELLSSDSQSPDNAQSNHCGLKLIFDAEDIVSSLDFQSVYLKIKSKIGSLSIQHFKRRTFHSKWKPGTFCGTVLRLREDIPTGERHEDNGFISITITRASCQHTHTLWGAINKKKKDKKSSVSHQLLSPTRYITELVVSIQPIDLIFSLKTLKCFYRILQPLIDMPRQSQEDELIASKVPSNTTVFSVYSASSNTFNNMTLPLAYLDCQDIRIIMPSSDLSGTGMTHDVFSLQVHKITLNPTAVNPICRSPIRPDIYQQAAQARILNVPGSEVEDRQYQLDIVGLSLSTSTWDNVETIFFNSTNIISSLHGTSENPALEWNNLEKDQLGMLPTLELSPITEKFDISMIVAPAMLYKNHTVVCGHSIEVNLVSDIYVNLSLNQIKLLSSLLSETIMLLTPIDFDEESMYKKPFYYGENNIIEKKDAGEMSDIFKDSGIDTADIGSIPSMKSKTNFTSPSDSVVNKTESEKGFTFPRPPYPLPQNYETIPHEFLFTGGKITFMLYDCDISRINITHYKRMNSRVTSKAEEDVGYEASEEGSVIEEKQDRFKKFVPLFYFSLSQPNVFVSHLNLGNKVQISFFDLTLKLNGSEFGLISRLPTDKDFTLNLIETRSGVPNPNTGILPAFFTLRYFKGIGKPASLQLEILKPTKVLCSLNAFYNIKFIEKKLLESVFYSKKVSFQYPKRSKVAVSNYAPNFRPQRCSENYSKFREIKKRLQGINAVNIELEQIVLQLKTESQAEVHLNFGKVESHFSLSSRPERIRNDLSLSCITVCVKSGDYSKLLLNPWSVSVDVCLFWEAWQNADSDPQIQISAESECIVLDISEEHIKSLQIVTEEVKEFIGGQQTCSATFEESKTDVDVETPPSKIVVDKEQHYKDDLRAGAFQYVDCNTTGADEIPLPYQVIFWSGNLSAMAWRYPQPRALTKVRVFPVPYKTALNSSDAVQVLCNLEYWSEVHNCYIPYTQFFLSENEVLHLTLPDGKPKKPVASTWRVVLNTINENEENEEKNLLLSPRVLVACMRIDSYFNKSLIPNITATLYISKIFVSLYSRFNPNLQNILPQSLEQYTPDLMFPESQCFFTFTIENLRFYLASWDLETLIFDITMATKCSVLDYYFLTEQSLVDLFSSKLEVSVSDSVKLSFISKPIQIKFGPSVAHTLAVSSQLWIQTLNGNNNKKHFVIMSRYVICNNTNVKLRFGQNNTDEDVLLAPKHFHLYCWRSQKQKQLLKVALEENEWIWSDSFSIDEIGTQMIPIVSQNNIVLVVTVKALSATQKQIILSGQLIVSNMLLEHFEMKLVEGSDKDKNFKNNPSHIFSGKTVTSSIFLNLKKKYFLRLRFYGLDSAWTGDIPLKEHTKGSQPWLVKVPLQERGQFLSIWCRVVVQNFPKGKKILAMLWPLFTVRSNLPVNTTVHMETPTLNVNLDSTVQGKGVLQQLYCPGTIDHSHQLNFNLENCNPTSTPYVPLNYSLVDQQQFFKKPEKEDIDTILEELNNYGKTKWPYFGDELDDIEWIIEEQPLTHIQVRYQNASLYSSALLLELVPWCLMINTLGCPISVAVAGTELFRLLHYGIIAPPKLDDTFCIRIFIKDTWYVSSPLQLGKSDWSSAFYMPVITGTIPLEGAIKSAVNCQSKYICMMSVTSSISNDMRLLKVSSTHVLTNHLQTSVHVICYAIPDCDRFFDIPNHMNNNSFNLPPNLDQNNTGMSIYQWHLIDNLVDQNTEYVLYMAFSASPSLGWSCPIRVDKNLVRSISINSADYSIPLVVTCQEIRNQFFVSLHHDNHPQTFIDNKSGITLYCAQFTPETNSKVALESNHFNWVCELKNDSTTYYTMPIISEKFPELPQGRFPEKIVFAADLVEGGNDFEAWSEAIDITADVEQFLKIPFHGDVKIVLNNLAHTTFILIESVSKVEFQAKDIRVRLSKHEKESVEYTSSNVNDNNKPYSIKPKLPVPGVSRSYSESQLDKKILNQVSNLQLLPTVEEKAYPDEMNEELSVYSTRTKRFHSEMNVNTMPRIQSSTEVVRTISLNNNCNALEICVFIKSFGVTLLLDKEIDGEERSELAAFTCDNLAVVTKQTQCMEVDVTVTDVQLDNQLYSRESFDFPVVLVGQKDKTVVKLKHLNVPIEQLVQLSTVNALLNFKLHIETWKDIPRNEIMTGVKSVVVSIQPLSCFIEDVYISRLLEYFSTLTPTTLVLWPCPKDDQKINLEFSSANEVFVPEIVLWQLAVLSRPLTMRSFTVDPVSLLLSLHCSIKLYIALDQSPLDFRKFEKRRFITTPYRLGHAVTMHYLSSAIFGAGWVVGSLELLGSPGGLARAMGTGLRDFVSLPYRGLIQGPWAFLRGVTHGSASLMRHVTAGTLQSVTKLASSVARNLDRLTLDEEHLKRTEAQRRMRPQGLTQGLVQGFTGLGISLLGAVGGIAHHPLQSVMTENATATSLAAGVGKGIVGVITKPLSGAAELVALAGQGLLQGAGWTSFPSARNNPVLYHLFSSNNSVVKYNWKFSPVITQSNILCITDATSIQDNMTYNAVALILTTESLIVFNTEEDTLQRIVNLNELTSLYNSNDPTLLSFMIVKTQLPVKNDAENIVEMDPACRARVADYVRNTVSLLHFLDDVNSQDAQEHPGINISPLNSPRISIHDDSDRENAVLTFYVNPQNRNYFLCLFNLAKQQTHDYNFPVL